MSQTPTDAGPHPTMSSAAARQLDDVLGAIPDSILILDRDYTITFANPQAIHLLSAGPLLGDNLFHLFPAAKTAPFFPTYRKSMEDRLPAEFEAFYADPLNAWYSVAVRPYGRDSIILFFTDISARKEAELARDRNAALLQQVLDSTSDGVVSLNRAWQFTYLNPRAEQILDRSIELNRHTLWDLYPHARGTDFERNYRLAMDQGIPSSFKSYYPAPLDLWLNLDVRPSDDGITIFFRDITADHQAAETLREQQALLAFVQQSSGVATWDLDLRTGVITYGVGSAPVFGLPLEDLGTPDAIRRIIHPDSLVGHGPAIPEGTPSDETITREYQLIAADGSSRWVESRSRAVYQNGVATNLRGVAIDINARKRNDQALAESERRYRVLADLNPQALWIGNPQGQITYANQGFLDYLGLDLSNLGNWLQCFDPTDRNRVFAAWTHSVQTGEAYDIEACLIRGSDRKSRWWHLRALPVRDNDRNIIQWLGVATDIHDRKTFEETLARQQLETERQRAELESVYENTPVGLGLFDPVEFRYLRLNDELARIIGLPKDQILGRTISEITGVDAVPELFRQAASGIPVRNHVLTDAVFRHDPGRTRSVNLNYFPVYDRDGRITAISTASLDITQQQKTEAALMQSEKLAAVGRLASSISHEINNPLEAITNLLYLVAQHEQLPQDLKVYVHMAQSEVARVSQIATQTLRFHRQAVNPTSVTAAQLVNAVLNLYQGRLANSAIRTDVRYNSTTPILCFENDIRQVLNNLIANAIDAMRTGGRLIVRAHNALDHQTSRPGVRILIADTGHGMSPTVMGRLFEPFFTTKDLNGTGLGLWISHSIVERHQGRLTVRSTQQGPRKGSIFSLFLPHAETAIT